MTKNDLVEAMAGQAEISKVAAEKALNAMIESITVALQKNERVSLVGFGIFEVSHRAARKGRNPKTGDAIEIQAANIPKFRAGVALKSAVN